MLSRFININKNIVYKQNKIQSLFVPKNNCRQLQYFYSKSPNQDLTNPEIEQEIEELTYKQEEDLVKKYNQKYTKNKAMSDVVEQMFFPDHAEQTQKQQIEEIKLQEKYEQMRKQGLISQKGEKKITLTEKEANYILALDSGFKPQLENAEGEIIKREPPQTKEDIIPAIQTIENNAHLLAFYLKYNSLFGKNQVVQFFIKLQENLQNQEYIKKVQIQKFLKKKEKLQKINPEVELQFTQQFLTKQEIQEHDGYQHILRNIEHKIKTYLPPRSGIHLCYKLFQFNKKIPKNIIDALLEKVQPQFDQLDIFPLMEFLRIMTFYHDLGLDPEQGKKLQYQVLLALSNLPDTDYTNITILTIIRSLYINNLYKKPMTFPPLFEKLESLIIKKISLFNIKQISDIFICFYFHQQGSPQFYNFIIMDIYRKKDQIRSHNHCLQILALCKKQHIQVERNSYNLNIIYEPFLIYLLENYIDNQMTPSQLNLILSSLYNNNINNKNYYQILSSQFLKNINQFNLQKFSNSLYCIVINGVHSKSLLNQSLKKLDKEIAILERELKQQPAGLLSPASVEFQNHIKKIEKESRLSYEDFQLQKLTHLTKSGWSIIYCMKKEMINNNYKLEQYDLDILNRYVYCFNAVIDNICQYSQKNMTLRRIYLEIIHQINQFLYFDTNGLIPTFIKIEEMTKQKNIQLQHFQYQEPKNPELSLFLLEKKLFIFKYINYIQRDPLYNNIYFNWKIHNPETNLDILFNINEYGQFTGNEANGLNELKDIYATEKKIPYMTISINDFQQYLDQGAYLGEDQLYFEKKLEKYLPKVENIPFINEEQYQELRSKRKLQQQYSSTYTNIPQEQFKIQQRQFFHRKMVNLRDLIYQQKGRVNIKGTNDSSQNQDELITDDFNLQIDIENEENNNNNLLSDYEFSDDEFAKSTTFANDQGIQNVIDKKV